MRENMQQPKRRSALRLKLGEGYYGLKRKRLWRKLEPQFAKERTAASLPHPCAAHETVLLRRLKDVDMWMQENKIINLKLAVGQLDGLLLRPGEIFSYWRLIGRPCRRKGYVEGMILRNGGFTAGVGGGLCQLSNLIFWMTLHTPLTVIERHRHGYDVFPDAGRTQPFGSGATCFYPHGDLMIRNDTENTYQLRLRVGAENLEGAWRCDAPPRRRYEIVERNHEMRSEYWGGYSRHNELYQRCYALDGTLLAERKVIENHALMMYSPFLEEGSRDEGQ